MKAQFKQGDVGEKLKSTLKTDGVPVDLTDATEVLLVVRNDRTQVTVEHTGQVEAGSDPLDGKVEYTWQAGDLDEVGNFVAEWRVSFTGGNVSSWPSTGYISIIVNDRLEV